MGKKKIRLLSRRDLPQEMTWDLEPLYPDSAGWEKDFTRLDRELRKFQKFQGRLKESAEILGQAFRQNDKLERLIEKVYIYAHLKADEDTADSTGQDYLGRISAKYSEVQGATAWFEPEILALSQKQFNTYLASPELKFYHRSLMELRRCRPHTLSGKEERLLGMAGDPLRATSQVFSMLNNADLRFPLLRDGTGQEQELTHGNYLKFLEDSDRQVRRNAFNAMYDTFGKLRNTFAANLDGAVRSHVFIARARNFPSALEAALHPDNISEEVYDNLIKTIREYLPVLHDYLRLRRRVFGLGGLRNWRCAMPTVLWSGNAGSR